MPGIGLETFSILGMCFTTELKLLHPGLTEIILLCIQINVINFPRSRNENTCMNASKREKYRHDDYQLWERLNELSGSIIVWLAAANLHFL